MSESTPPRPARVSPADAVSLAVALGVACTLAGVAMTGYTTGYLDGTRLLQFSWLLILFFGLPGGYVVLSEFTSLALLNLSIVQWAKHISKWAMRGVFSVSTLGFAFFPESMISLAKYFFIIPGPALIVVALLEKYAMNLQDNE